MRIPAQSPPVQRAALAYSVPSVDDNASGASTCYFGSDNGVVACASVDPSGWFDDVVGTVGKVAGVAGPILGAFGI